MMKSHAVSRWIVAGLVIATALGLAQAARAQSPSVELHGFGGWAYADTDGNNLLIGTEDGTYDNLSFALNINAKVSDRLTVVGQFEFQQRPGFDDLDRTLDFAFAEWKVNDGFKIRAGRVKHPFGIYGEIFNVGTLRPFYLLPQSIYGPERYSARSVDGLGLTGQHTWNSDWGLTYDVYAGRIAGEFRFSGVSSDPKALHLGLISTPFGFEEVVGGRLNVTPPVKGLTIGTSAYRGVATGILSAGSKEVALNISAEYQTDRLLVRSEYGTISNYPVIRIDTYYAETAYKVWRGLQLAVRYDHWKGTAKDKAQGNIPWFNAVLKHDDWTLGVNYWLSPNLVAKVNYHIVDGNRFAQPDDPRSLIGKGGSFESKTNMLVFGTHFSF